MRKKILNIASLTGVMAALLLNVSCETTDLDLQNDPNNPTLSSADPDLLLNQVQLSFVNMFENLNYSAMVQSRQLNQFSTYANSLQQFNLNNTWDDAYQDGLQNLEVMLNITDADGLYHHSGMAKVLKAYYYIVLVDFFKDVPYSEALQPDLYLNPLADDGQSIYTSMLTLLDEAISDLNQDVAVGPADDLFYNGNMTNWITLANTLKLKMYSQMRLVDPTTATTEINAIVSSGDYITSATQDFKFTYSTENGANGDFRHPTYASNYTSAGADGDYNGGSGYLSNPYMFYMKDNFSVSDPRLRYYFYRPSEFTEGEASFCDGTGDYVYCYVGDNYWGRDHGDDNGIPADNTTRSIPGLYPAGGAFDSDAYVGATSVSSTLQNEGAGILPILMSSFIQFKLAENTLTLGTTGDAKTYLENGIRESISTVMSFSDKTESTLVPSSDDVDAYVTEVLAAYDAAASNEDKLKVIIDQYNVAAFGNGYEIYNAYRLTGAQGTTLQTGITAIGNLPLSYLYPLDFVNNNTNISQKPSTERIFWDTNTANLN